MIFNSNYSVIVNNLIKVPYNGLNLFVLYLKKKRELLNMKKPL